MQFYYNTTCSFQWNAFFFSRPTWFYACMVYSSTCTHLQNIQVWRILSRSLSFAAIHTAGGHWTSLLYTNSCRSVHVHRQFFGILRCPQGISMPAHHSKYVFMFGTMCARIFSGCMTIKLSRYFNIIKTNTPFWRLGLSTRK